MSEYTPRPWSVLDHTKEPPTQQILCVTETGFALECEPFESISDVDRANARLMAAAPDLFETCEDVLALHFEIQSTWEESPLPKELVAKLQAAITKAKGEQ